MFAWWIKIFNTRNSSCLNSRKLKKILNIKKYKRTELNWSIQRRQYYYYYYYYYYKLRTNTATLDRTQCDVWRHQSAADVTRRRHEVFHGHVTCRWRHRLWLVVTVTHRQQDGWPGVQSVLDLHPRGRPTAAMRMRILLLFCQWMLVNCLSVRLSRPNL